MLPSNVHKAMLISKVCTWPCERHAYIVCRICNACWFKSSRTLQTVTHELTQVIMTVIAIFTFPTYVKTTPIPTIDWLIDDHLYSAILRSLEQTHCARLWFYMSDKLFKRVFFYFFFFWISTEVVYLSAGMAGATWNLPSRRKLCTPYNHAPCHLMQSHIRKVYACLAVTCHLHFWQNDRIFYVLLRVTRGWNGYRN